MKDFRSEVEKIRSANQNMKPDFEAYAREVVSFIQTELARLSSENKVLACIVIFDNYVGQEYDENSPEYGGPYADFFSNLHQLLAVDFDHYYHVDDGECEEPIWELGVPSWMTSEEWVYVVFNFDGGSANSWNFGSVEISVGVEITKAVFSPREDDDDDWEDDNGPRHYEIWRRYYTEENFFVLKLF